jgi:hypothetical protein
MAVNPNLLAQAIQPQPTAFDAFVPAFQQSQDRIDTRQMAAQENETRLQEMKLKWSEYYQKHQGTQQKAAQDQRIREIMQESGGDPAVAQRLMLQEGLIDPASKLNPMVPEPEKAPQDPEVVRLAAIENDTNRPQHERDAARAARVKATAVTQSEGDQRDRKIAGLVGQTGINGQPISPEDAAAIVDGQIRVEINPTTGMIVYTDIRTGKVTELPISAASSVDVAAGLEIPGEAEAGEVWQAAQAGTGMLSVVREFIWNRGAMQLPIVKMLGGTIDEQTSNARQVLNAAMGELRRSMSLNPRFPVGEMERIEQEFQIKSTAWDSPEALRSRLRAIDGVIDTRIKAFEVDANNPQLPATVRAQQRSNANAMRQFQSLIQPPPETELPTSAQESGVSKELWDVMTPEERALWQ